MAGLPTAATKPLSERELEEAKKRAAGFGQIVADWETLVEESPGIAAAAAKGWLDACGAIVGLATGAILFKGPGGFDALGSYRAAWTVGAAFGLVLLVAALWSAASAAYAVSTVKWLDFFKSKKSLAQVRAGTYGRRVRRMKISRGLLVCGMVLVFFPQVVVWLAPDEQVVKVTTCADLATTEDMTIVIESPTALPESVPLDDVSELTLTPCAE